VAVSYGWHISPAEVMAMDLDMVQRMVGWLDKVHKARRKG